MVIFVNFPNNKHKSCEIDGSAREVDGGQSVEGRIKRQCHDGFIRYL